MSITVQTPSFEQLEALSVAEHFYWVTAQIDELLEEALERVTMAERLAERERIDWNDNPALCERLL